MIKAASKAVGGVAVLLGSIGSMAWLTFVMAVSKGFAGVEVPWGWFFLVVIAGIFFLIPFLLVPGIVPLIRGVEQAYGRSSRSCAAGEKRKPRALDTRRMGANRENDCDYRYNHRHHRNHK